MTEIEFFTPDGDKTKDSKLGAPCVRVQITFESEQRTFVELALIDTGSNLTMVQESMMAGLTPSYTSTSNTANGPMQTYIYEATIALEGESTATPILVGILRDKRFKILLGRDFLLPFVMTYDPPHGKFSLERPI
jgi:predicted aspartyl protease